jgi:hypothetical protein
MEAGNSQTMIQRHYAELVRPDAAGRWFAILPDTAQSEATRVPPHCGTPP